MKIIAKLDVAARLEELKRLEDGWLDHKGLAPAGAGLDWLSGKFGVCYPDDRQLPYIYPTAEGNIRAEWSLGKREISLEVNLLTHLADWHNLNTEDESDQTRDLNLNFDDDWKWIAEQIRDAEGAA